MATDKVTIQVPYLDSLIFRWLGELSPAQYEDFVCRLLDTVMEARARRGAASVRRPRVARRGGVVQFQARQTTAQQGGAR